MMWDANDTNAAIKLLRIATDALGQNPPDRRTALYGFSEVAGFNWSEGNVAAAERFALQTLEVANDVHSYDRVRILAAEVLLMVANRRNAIGDQERAADQMLSAVQLYRSGDEVQDRKMAQDFVRTLWEYDPTLLPTKSLKLAIDRLPPRYLHLRTYLQGLEGISVARDGNWKAGLELLTRSVTNSFCNVGLWHAAVQLAALAGNEELRSSLSVVGLSRFASGADAQASEALVEPLLIRTPDPANLPTTRELLDRVFLGPQWVKVSGYFSRALLEFHTGQYDVAANSIDRYLRDVAFVIKNGANPLLARGWFARAMIEIRRGHATEAREAYLRGLKLHSNALQAPGTPYKGDIWVDACTAELLRREAAKLLGNATPASP
jgi:tetratricopeptide (TPR) repeat protein